MRYSAFFISTTDESIQHKRPGRVNLSIKPDTFKIELFKKIPMQRITGVTVQHDISNKQLSAGKALGGAVLAGPVGAVVGATMGGKKITSVMTVSYADENGVSCEIALETKLAAQIKEKLDKYRQTIITTPLQTTGTAVQPEIKPRSSSLQRGLFIYFTWPYQLYKKLTNSHER